MDFFERMVRALNRSLAGIGGLFLLAMIVLTCGNILLRLLWVPIPGTYELMGFFGAVVASFALGYTQVKKGHIAVDVLIDAFPLRVRRGLTVINSVICIGFVILCAWQIWIKADTIRRTGELTETLRIIYYPFTHAVAVGFGLMALAFVLDLWRCLGEVGEGES